jgi:hypothetical protein
MESAPPETPTKTLSPDAIKPSKTLPIFFRKEVITHPLTTNQIFGAEKL